MSISFIILVAIINKMKKNTSQKIRSVSDDSRLSPEQASILEKWVVHHQKFRNDEQILSTLYTLREFGLFINKPYESAVPGDVLAYVETKIMAVKSVTGSRVLDIKRSSVLVYKQRITWFYRWLKRHTQASFNEELAYPKPKVVETVYISKEERCEKRVIQLLENDKNQLSIENLEILKKYHNYKVTSGKVDSYTGFSGKLYFLKRLGVFFGDKNYKQATREDIAGFLRDVQVNMKSRKEGEKTTTSSTYKAHLLDFYRFVYNMFGDEQPRVYPDVVSWLYQKRKKGHDKLPKEVISDNEIKTMIEKCSEVRDKALIALMADCSARVGEIINTELKDLRINEISVEGAQYKHAIATIVLRGKTGERTNQLFYSVPHLRLWLLNHPLKDNPRAPLFIATKENRYGQKLGAVGINKMLQRAARKAKVTRHIHAHLFRHTNLTRMARILSETELKIHAGWGSDSKMASVYVHLNEKDVADKILATYGLKPKEEQKAETVFKIQICPNTVCSYQNPGEATFCQKCGYPLTLKTAVSLARIKEHENELQNELLNRTIDINTIKGQDIKEAMYQILKSDPALIEKLNKILSLAENIANVNTIPLSNQ